MNDLAPHSDRRAFALAFGACVTPPLAFVVVFLAERPLPGGADRVVEILLGLSMWAWALVYLFVLVRCVRAFVSRDSARGLAILAAMLAAALVGVAAVWAFFQVGYSYA